jgi:hypothetical protein
MPSEGQFNLTVVIPWILTLLTAVLGIWQFTAQQRQANRQPFLQKQLELSFQATEPQAVWRRRPIPSSGKRRGSLSGNYIGGR